MTKHGNRAQVHDNEIRKFENSREEENSMEQEKLRELTIIYEERAKKRDADQKYQSTNEK